MTTLMATILAIAPGQVSDKLPDVSLLASELANAFVTTNNQEFPGTLGLRFSTASVNYGNGRLEIRGGQVTGNVQLVNQRIYRSDNSFYDRPAGTFTYHPQHGHIHFDDWTVFRLRQMLPNNGVGDVVAQGAKTSFCIIELRRVNTSAPGHNDAPSYNSCGQIQGLRPGWADIYGSSLYGQVINITGVPNGIYWLEGDIDPNNFILESDETNNQVRIPVAIGPVPTATPDAYEENDSIAQVNARPEGTTNSPNMGLILNPVFMNNLSMDDADDWYKIRIHAGSPGAYIQMESPYLQQSNINLQLTNAAGTVVRSSTGSYSWENISLDGLAEGTYFIRVYRSGTGNNPNYRLTINPTPNDPPFLTLNEPLPGERLVEKSLMTFPVVWNGGDPNLDPKYVSLLRSRARDHSQAEPIPGYQDMQSANGSVNINTADFGLKRWFILGVGTDGGAQTLSWAPGTVYLYRKGDITEDGHYHRDDYELARKLIRAGSLRPLSFAILDIDRNGIVNDKDLKALLELIEHDHGD
jgi:hypothetical protein